MPLINAKCTNCGSVLEVDQSKEAWVCPHCNSPFIVEKAINNYQTTINNSFNIQNATFVAPNSDFTIENGILRGYSGESPIVKIPNSVREIGYEALKGLKHITEVIMNDNITAIDIGAFANCINLQKVKFSESLTHIGNGAFFNCKSLKSIYIPADVTKIDRGDLYYISRNTSKNYYGYDEVSESVKKVLTANGLEGAIGMFLACNAFLGCTSVETIEVSPENTKYYSKGNCLVEKNKIGSEDGIVIFGCEKSDLSHGLSIGVGAFIGCKTLKHPQITTSWIRERAFFGVNKTPKVTITPFKGSLTIDCYAFRNWVKGQTIVIKAKRKDKKLNLHQDGYQNTAWVDGYMGGFLKSKIITDVNVVYEP